MAKTIGERLRETREDKGLSIEDVAHATRIHSNTLIGLEEDDYSGFASTTYAKSFLTLYAKHLGIDTDAAVEQFKRSDTSPVVGGANYIRSVAEAIEPIERTTDIRSSSHYVEAKPQRRRGEQTAHPIFLGLFLIILLAIIPILYLAGKEAKSPEEAWSNITRMTGGDDSGTQDDASGTQDDANDGQTPGLNVSARPGTRVTPAAPMTRRTYPAPKSTPTTADVVKAIPASAPTPIAQADAPKAKPIATPIAKPISDPVAAPAGEPLAKPTADPTAAPVAIPIRATPIVAVPVQLPIEEEDPEAEETDGDTATEEPATETAADADADADGEDEPAPAQGNDGGATPAPGTATTASRSSQ